MNYSVRVERGIDNRFDFLDEIVYRDIRQGEIEEIWDMSANYSLREKIIRDLKSNSLFLAVHNDDTVSQANVKIYPVIEIFYTDVRGFLFWCKSFAKVRLSIRVTMDDKEIINDKFESFYLTKGSDSEWEGSKWQTIEEGANITIGVALRQTLDKFYYALESKLQ